MRRINNKSILILIVLSCYLFLSLIFLINNLEGVYYDVINPLVWGVVFILCCLFFRSEYVNKKHRFDILLTTIILLILFFIFYYLSGLVVGFQKTPYDNSLNGIVYNFWTFAPMIIFQEYIRKFLINRTGRDRKIIVVITLLFILFDIGDTLINYKFDSFENVFKFFVIFLNPSIAKHALLSYLTYTSDVLPSLIYRLIIEMFSFIVPFIPNFNWFLMGVINLVYPFTVFLNVYRILHKKEEKKKYKKKYKGIFFYLPVITIIFILVILVSGVFKYQLVAIASNSMNPVFYRGDAVIMEKINDRSSIKIGDIIVFEHNGSMIVHRVIEKIDSNNDTYVYKTKGDNNKDPDPYVVTDNQLIGKFKLGIKFIGYPSVMLQDILSKK